MEKSGQQQDGVQGGKKQSFFIKKIPSKECCLEILSFCFYKEEIERLLRMLSKQARQYYNQNQDMIEQMKSMIEYDFNLGNSKLDMRNIQELDLTCSDISVVAAIDNQLTANQILMALSKVQEKYSTSNLKKLSMNLTTTDQYIFIGHLSQIFNLSNIDIIKSSQGLLQNLLAQQQLKISTLSLTMPEVGYKQSSQHHQQLNIDQNLINNGNLRNLQLNFSANIKDNYLDFTKLLLKNKSIGTFKINLNNKEYISDINLCKFLAYTNKLYKLTLSNIQFTNKNSYISFCLYLQQNYSIQEIEVSNCIFFDKLKSTFFNCLSERKPIINTLILNSNHIDSSNIGMLAQVIQKNPLKHLELVNILKDKQKMLPIQDIFTSLIDKQTLSKLIIKDKQIRINQTISKQFSKFIRSKPYLQRLELELENYEDIFDQVNKVSFDYLGITAIQVDKFSLNKLFFDIAQGLIQVNQLKLSGGLTDAHIQKISHLSSKQGIKELDISRNQLTDESCKSIQQFIYKSTQLQKIDFSSNSIGDSGMIEIITNGISMKNRLSNINFGLNSLKNKGIMTVLNAFSTFNYLKLVDLTYINLTNFEQVNGMERFLENNASIEEIKMPRILITKESENNEACFELFRALIHQRSLIYATVPFFFKAIRTYDDKLMRKEQVYNLKITSIRKLTVLNCNLEEFITDIPMKKLEALEQFLHLNPHVWIKNPFSSFNKLRQAKSFAH